MTRNLLSEETSPYLLQHRDNPVHWRAWNADSLAEAKRENKPILLSIGYAACHWCHVMAHESFENEDIAGLMNELFISIKVDREERPDIDVLYQSALSMMGEHGGWPLTMFLTPEAEPFWGGTYFPATGGYGRPAFPDLLKSISRTFHDENAKVMENAAVLKENLVKLATPEGGGELTTDKLDQVATMILHAVDPIKGGTQGAPKFPQPSLFRFLWNAHRRLGQRTGQRSDSSMFGDAVTLTLNNICQGGIYDHLGGGFARYSTDEVWLAPHFEKMLYDNAQLIDLMTDVWLETQNPLYAQRTRETVDWLMREMRSADEGPFAFTSALDADSEGEEGRFYVWSEDEIDEILGPEAPFFKEAYDVSPGGNWEGKVILNRSHDLRLGDGETEARLKEAREKLLAVRGGRIRPERDDKVLADWNGLMIAALARAGMVFGQPSWIDAAKAAFGFVLEFMTETGSAGERLRHSWCSGRLQHPAVLDDYANMALAALALHGVTGDPEYLARAERWTGTADAHYWDGDGGGYFLSADDTDDVIARSKPVHDNAVPSGNGVMAQVLARLFYLTGDSAYRDRAEALIRAITGKEPGAMVHQPTLLGAFEILESGVQAVIIAAEGDPAEDGFRHAVYAAGLTNLMVNRLRPGHDLPPGHPAHGKEQVDGKATVYVCRGPVCGLPLTGIDALREELARL